ncbi:MAG TPA: ChaN family lipoprotein [Geomonas sp.]|nr:ChaN family lipoprotein [Geomonas sp.]
MKRLTSFISSIVLLLATGICANAAQSMVRVSDHTPVEFGQVVTDLERADAIFIGDTHDDSELHGKQLDIIRALYAKDPHLAIGLEMFTIENQASLDQWTSGKLEEKDFIHIYSQNWSYDWSLYRDIFIFARDNRIPMIALNLPKQLIANVVRQGGQGLSEADKKELPPGEVWTLTPRQLEYMKRIRQQVFGNRPVPPRLANFDQAQALRNHSMGYRVVKFREKSPQTKVVVVAGVWHAIKNGAPDSLKEYGNCSYKVVLPELREFSWMKPTAEDVDYLIPGGE